MRTMRQLAAQRDRCRLDVMAERRRGFAGAFRITLRRRPRRHSYGNSRRNVATMDSSKHIVVIARTQKSLVQTSAMISVDFCPTPPNLVTTTYSSRRLTHYCVRFAIFLCIAERSEYCAADQKENR